MTGYSWSFALALTEGFFWLTFMKTMWWPLSLMQPNGLLVQGTVVATQFMRTTSIPSLIHVRS